MPIKFKKKQDCRAYQVNMTQDLTTRHFEITKDFIMRGHYSVGGSSSGPLEGKPGWFFMSFSLPIEVADEYERRMRT